MIKKTVFFGPQNVRKSSDISRAVAAITNLPSSTLPDSPFIRALGTPEHKGKMRCPNFQYVRCWYQKGRTIRPKIMAHKISSCINRSFSPKKEPVTSLLCGVVFWFVCFWFVCLCSVFVLCCFLFLFLCFLVFSLVFWMIVTVHRTMYRSSTSLLLRPLQLRPLRDFN